MADSHHTDGTDTALSSANVPRVTNTIATTNAPLRDPQWIVDLPAGGLPLEIELKIFSHTEGVGDIVEVMYDKGELFAKYSTSSSFRIFTPMVQGETKKSREKSNGMPTIIFENLNLVPPNTKDGRQAEKGYLQDMRFDPEYILFLSQMMTPKNVLMFVKAMKDEDRGRIEKIAFNDSWFELSSAHYKNMEILLKFPNLRCVILVSEVHINGGTSGFGPWFEPQEIIEFITPSETAERAIKPYTYLDRMRAVEDQLMDYRKSTKGAWPNGNICVDVVGIKRNGKLCEGNYNMFGAGTMDDGSRARMEQLVREEGLEVIVAERVPGPDDPATDDEADGDDGDDGDDDAVKTEDGRGGDDYEDDGGDGEDFEHRDTGESFFA